MAGADVGGEEGALGSHYDWSRESRPNCDYLAFGHLVKIGAFSDRTRSLLGMQSIHCRSCSDPSFRPYPSLPFVWPCTRNSWFGWLSRSLTVLLLVVLMNSVQSNKALRSRSRLSTTGHPRRSM